MQNVNSIILIKGNIKRGLCKSRKPAYHFFGAFLTLGNFVLSWLLNERARISSPKGLAWKPYLAPWQRVPASQLKGACGQPWLLVKEPAKRMPETKGLQRLRWAGEGARSSLNHYFIITNNQDNKLTIMECPLQRSPWIVCVSCPEPGIRVGRTQSLPFHPTITKPIPGRVFRGCIFPMEITKRAPAWSSGIL